jgi:hypothetical protein
MSITLAIKKYKTGLFVAVLVVLVPALSFLAWQRYFPVTVGSGWTLRVYMDDIPMVSALARDDQGVLYITREQNKQQGSLFKQRPDGSIQEVMSGLDKPDGLLAFRGGILVSQEGGEYALLWLHDGRVDKLFKGNNIEGIDSDAKYIYAIEDMKTDGRLLQVDVMTGLVVALRGGLHSAEGVAVCPDGRLFYSEKKKGWVKQYRADAAADPVVHSGLNLPGFLLCNGDGLWIAEDATQGARLLLAGPSGTLQVVLGHLRSAQTVLQLAPGRLLVAEQGRNRILEISRTPDGSK